MALLREERGDRRYTLGARFTIGRASDNDVALAEDTAASRRHAAVLASAEGYEIEDLGSANGTFLERGGTRLRVSERMALEDGDVICAGNARLVFEAGGAGEPTETVDAGLTQVPELTRAGNVVPVGLPPDDYEEEDEERAGRLVLLALASGLAAAGAVVVSLLLASAF